jgi:hypothetical protein
MCLFRKAARLKGDELSAEFYFFCYCHGCVCLSFSLSNRSSRSSRSPVLLSDIELLNDLSISSDVLFHEIVEKPSPFADKFQQSEATVMILHVLAEVRRQARDMGRQNRDLNLGRSRVIRVLSEFVDDFYLLVFCDRHCYSLPVNGEYDEEIRALSS